MQVVSTGHLTYGEANKVKNQLLEDMPLEDGEQFHIGCFLRGSEYRYFVEVISDRDSCANSGGR